ncbi:hypothetical protein ACFQ48_01235 [Hymenobacter caeli]|uniref:Biopolymer transport protein ExbD n=1 Tax=Hymenobacter caeli TaxID=2735894 RepID=A0ABX2FK05_9BACT|nr:hypothetical protein [Hymenobacter caeli]NRT17444.1 biopolymer transport protein ExbD [Hymenobacter caeli]
MVSLQLKSSRNRYQGLSMPDMAPFASLIFIIVCFYPLTGRLKGPESGLVADDRLPGNSAVCWHTPEHNAVVSLNQANELSFSGPNTYSNTETQTAAIKQVASQHKIVFTASQLAELRTIPFLATTVQQLPQFLDLAAVQRHEAIRLGDIGPLSEAQLIECVTAAKKLSITLERKNLYFTLNIDVDTKASNVMHLISLLQTAGINRFDLATQMK